MALFFNIKIQNMPYELTIILYVASIYF